VSGQLARRNARRNPRRTAASAAALVVGVGIAVVFSVLAASIKAGTGGELERAITADVVVAAPSFGGGGLSPQLADEVQGIDGVAASTAVSRGVAVVAGSTTELAAAEGPALGKVLALDVAAGDVAGVDGDHLAVSRSLAHRRGWSFGDRVTVQFADGASWQPTIAAIYRSTTVVGDVVVPRSVWAAHTSQLIDRLLLVQARPGTDVPSLRAAIARAAAPFGAPTVEDAAGYATSVAGRIDLVLGIVDVLLALAVLIALMGVATTASLAVHERRREVGLLRAVGQTTRQTRSMVRIETTVVALYGTLVGTVLGLFIGWGLVAAIGTGSVKFSLPILQLAIVVVAGAVAGALAGRRPARKAAKADVLTAIAN
jgi:putative ABC transport system permease protein